MLSAKYYIRPRKEENPRRWQGPYDAAQLKDLADRRLFSRELHEYSEDQLNWIPARQLWGELFPKEARPIANLAPPVSYLPPVKPAISSAISPEAKLAAKSSDGSSAASTDAQQESPEWYYAQEGRQLGPMSLLQIQGLAAHQILRPTDLVWTAQFGNKWIEAATVPEIFPRVDSSLHAFQLPALRLLIPLIAAGFALLIFIGYGIRLLFVRPR